MDELTAARAAKARYMREYRRRHPERAKAINIRYWARRDERERQQPEPDNKTNMTN